MRSSARFDHASEHGWPCQRLRMGFALVFISLFEIFIGRKLPAPLPALSFGMGLACLGSAAIAIRSWRLEAAQALVRNTVTERRGRLTAARTRNRPADL